MKEYNLGILALLSYNLFTAAKGVFLGSFLQNVHPFLVLSFCFGCVTIGFSTLNLFQKKTSNTVNIFQIYKNNWRTILGLNISAVLGWVGYFYALKLIEPAIVVSFTQGAGPIITAVYYLLTQNRSKTTTSEWWAHAVTCLVLIWLVIISYSGLSAVGSISCQQVLGGTLAALICGITNVVNTFLTKGLNNAGLKPRHIIPVRFLLLILLGFCLISNPMWSSLDSNTVIISILAIALFGLAMPIFLVQVGIQKTNPGTVSLAMASLPIFMLACQFFDNRLTASTYSAIGSFSVSIIYMVSLILKSPPQITLKKSVSSKII